MEKEKEVLSTLIELEDLAEKKAKIHSRLLIEPSIAQEMERISKCHAQRKLRLKTLLTGKVKKEEKDEA